MLIIFEKVTLKRDILHEKLGLGIAIESDNEDDRFDFIFIPLSINNYPMIKII